MSRKLDAAKNPPEETAVSKRQSSQLPRKAVQEVIDEQQLVIIEYISQLLFRSFQEVINRQLVDIRRESSILLQGEHLRGDSLGRGS